MTELKRGTPKTNPGKGFSTTAPGADKEHPRRGRPKDGYTRSHRRRTRRS